MILHGVEVLMMASVLVSSPAEMVEPGAPTRP